MASNSEIIERLAQIVGADNVLSEADVTQRFRRDWTGRFEAPDAVVVRPASTEEAASIVSLCREHDVAIVAQGGNTGLAGGATPVGGELVISTQRMSAIESVNANAGFVTAQAGASLAAIQNAAGEAGWDYGIDLASREIATLGGMIASNACGSKVIRYGDTRAQLTGIEVVTGTGDVVSAMGGTLRDNTGYNLPHLIAGSEGTLGVITRATLRLHPRQEFHTTALLRFDRIEDAAHAAEAMRRTVPSVEAVELFIDSGLELVCSTFNLEPPFTTTSGGYVMVDVAGDTDQTGALAEAVESLTSVADVAVAEDSTMRARLRQYLDNHNGAIMSVGIAHKFDVAVPPGSLGEFVTRVPEVVAAATPEAHTWLFGHGGESSVHVNVTGQPQGDLAADRAVIDLVAELDGAISSDYGIGRAKLAWMGTAHSETHLALLRSIKAAFDPDGIMNPGVLIPS